MLNIFEMTGQWLGHFKGTNQGIIVLNIETRNPYVGRLMIYDSNYTAIFSMWASISFTVKGNELYGTLFDFLIFDGTQLNTVEMITKSFPNYSYPTEGFFKAYLKNGSLEGEWNTNISTGGKFSIIKSLAEEKSKATFTLENWNDFKKWVQGTDKGGDLESIYRGQINPNHRLRTTFHRTGRNDLVAYERDDLPVLVHYINATPGYNFDLTKIEDFGGLLNLAQHHGFPTPLLDWTESPYIAAFFAYENVLKSDIKGYVRILIFNFRQWANDFPGLQQATVRISTPTPTISVRILPAKNNSRALPQQSISIFSNIDDIESFIGLYESFKGSVYLTKIDLPRAERNRVLRELRLMGITAASLFPGLDGTCRALKERLF